MGGWIMDGWVGRWMDGTECILIDFVESHSGITFLLVIFRQSTITYSSFY